MSDTGTLDLRDLDFLGVTTLNLSAAGNALQLTSGNVANDPLDGSFAGAVNGGAGNDQVVISGATSNGYIFLHGNGGNDTLTGGIGGDHIYGGGGADSLTGGAGNDYLYIAAADDLVAGEIYDGGADNDNLDGGYTGVALNLSTVTITGIENLLGFTGGVTLTSAQLDGFSGYSHGGYSLPEITLSDTGTLDLRDLHFRGDTTLNLNAAGNTLQLTSKNGNGDPLDGTFKGTVHGGAGNDQVVISGTDFYGYITLNGNGGNDTLTGGVESDSIFGGTGADLLTGGGGADFLYGGTDLDAVFGGAGGDSLYISAPDHLVAGETYDGGDGDSADRLIGGYTGVALDLSIVTITGIENLVGFDAGVTLTSAQLDGLSGYTAWVPVITLSDTGTLDLRDVDFGGVTTLNLSATGNTLQLTSLNHALDPLDGTFEGTVNGGAGNDQVVISGDYSFGNITLNGNDGNDTLTGGIESDLIFGGTGVDSLTGGAGNDYLYITAAADLVAGETYDGGADTDFLYGGYTGVALDISAVTITGIEYLAGFTGGVTLTSAQLDGFSGDIFGLTSLITLSDTGTLDLRDLGFMTVETTLNLSAAGNTLQLTSGHADGDPLNGAFVGAVNGGAGNDQVVISGARAFGTTTLNGNGGNDTLTGGVGDDSIFGGTGADLLTSGAGFDSLTGGDGIDTFVFAHATDVGETDNITDFQFGSGGDVFQVTGALGGTVRYIGADTFEVGANGLVGVYTMIRFAAEGIVEIDYDGDFILDATVHVAGLTSATQLVQLDNFV